MIFGAFFKALGQIGDPAFRGVLLRGIGLTVALLAAMTVGLQWLLPDTISLPWFGEVVWVSRLLSGFALIAMFGLSIVLMVPVASVFTGFYLERIADAVEQKHYPELAPAQKIGAADIATDTLKFLGLMVVVNVLALIIYLLSTVLAPVIFWIVNGLLLGREYFQMVAMRRVGRHGADALRRKHFLIIWAAGVLMAVPLTVPFVNLIIPVLGVATFTHLYHRLAET